MGPEFGIGIERNAGTPQRPRPSLLVRLIEFAGLGLVAYGLGAYRFALVAVGAAMIVGSYALYRRKHGPLPDAGSGFDGNGMGGDGGGD